MVLVQVVALTASLTLAVSGVLHMIWTTRLNEALTHQARLSFGNVRLVSALLGPLECSIGVWATYATWRGGHGVAFVLAGAIYAAYAAYLLALLRIHGSGTVPCGCTATRSLTHSGHVVRAALLSVCCALAWLFAPAVEHLQPRSIVMTLLAAATFTVLAMILPETRGQAATHRFTSIETDHVF